MAEQAVTIALFYSGVWNDESSGVYVRERITITHGRADESQQPEPAKALLTFDNRTGRYNPRNPASPLFGLIGRNTPIRITMPSSTRFVGEVASWTPKIDVSGHDAWTEVVAAGVSRRLGQGADPLNDALRRAIEGRVSTLVGYWPLDDADGSTQARAVLRGSPMKLSNEAELSFAQSLPAFGAGQLAPWLPAGIETREAGSLEARVQGPVAGSFTVAFVYRATRASDGNIPLTTLVNALTDTPHNFQVFLDPGLLPRVQVIDSDGSTLAVLEGDPAPEIYDGLPHLIQLRVLDITGDNVSVSLDVDRQTVISEAANIGQASLDPLARVVLFWEAGGIGVLPIRLGQVSAYNGAGILPLVDEFLGHAGEHAGRRIERLCDEEGVPFVPVPFDADLDDTQPCGPQYPDGFLAILREAADLDHGILVDSRPVLERALAYRTGRSLYSQDPILSGLDFDAGQVAPPLDPVLDDQATRNDVTVQRRDGDSVRVTLDTGPMSTETPPDGVGRVQESITVNTMGDGLLGDLAGWRLHLGTTDEVRFPQVSVDVAAATEVEVLASVLSPGDRLTIANLPAGLNPDLANLLVQGYTEVIGPFERLITFNCTPEEPFHIAEVEHADYGIIGHDRTTVGDPFDAGTDTTMTAQIAGGSEPGWTDADGEFDIFAAGVRLHVTSLSQAGQLVTFTVDQTPVNGVVKTIPSGSPVDVFHKSYIGL